MTTPEYPARHSPVAAYLEQAIARSKLTDRPPAGPRAGT